MRQNPQIKQAGGKLLDINLVDIGRIAMPAQFIITQVGPDDRLQPQRTVARRCRMQNRAALLQTLANQEFRDFRHRRRRIKNKQGKHDSFAQRGRRGNYRHSRLNRSDYHRLHLLQGCFNWFYLIHNTARRFERRLRRGQLQGPLQQLCLPLCQLIRRLTAAIQCDFLFHQRHRLQNQFNDIRVGYSPPIADIIQQILHLVGERRQHVAADQLRPAFDRMKGAEDFWDGRHHIGRLLDFHQHGRSIFQHLGRFFKKHQVQFAE